MEDLEKRRLELTRKCEAMQNQLGQAQMLVQQLPLQIANIRGEMAGLEYRLAEEQKKKK